MNKIQKYFKSIFDSRSQNEKLAIEFSNQIQALIQIEPSKFERESYQFSNWKIVSTRRAYSNGWVSLFEAYPREYPDNIGYVNSKNPEWIKVDGTATVVIMPSYMRDEFIKDLKSHLED